MQIPTEMLTSYFSSLGIKYVNAVTLVILSVLRYSASFKRACKRSLGAWGERIAYDPGQVRFQLKILKPILPFVFIFYRGSNYNFRTTRFYYYLPNNLFDIAFHFIFHCNLLSFLLLTHNQWSVVSALLATTTRYSMTASRDYMMSTWCPWRFLLYASRLLLRHTSASHCRMHVWNGNMPPEFDPRTVQPVASRYTNWATWPIKRHSTVIIVRSGGKAIVWQLNMHNPIRVLVNVLIFHVIM
jgi:hypothetical protein